MTSSANAAAEILNNYLHFATAADHESATDAVIMSGEFDE